MKKTRDVENITSERNKAVSQCLNLQGKKVQLNLLINQLQNLAQQRNINSVNVLLHDYSDQLDYLKPANSVITRELDKVLQDHEKLNNDINSLKEQIKLLNNKLKL